jgi:putative ABC transport system ATP-binding protein
MADEPTGNLDTKSTLEIIDIFKKLNESGKTVIMVTHEPDLANMTQRIVTMRDGRITDDQWGGKVDVS